MTSWSRFLVRQAKAPPLVFIHGVRHTVSCGVPCGMHSHRALEIVYHPVGRGVTRMEDGRTIAFNEGDAVIYAPRERHDQIMEREGEDLCVQLAVPSRGRAMPGHGLHISSVADSAVIEDLRLLSRGHVQITPTEQAMFNLRATSTLLALVHQACNRTRQETRNNSKNYVLKAEQYMRGHFATIESLRRVAEHVGISQDHLRHAFQALRKKSMVRYLNEIRVDRAKTLLIHTRLPLKQIATMCGFNDPYYFSAVFQNFAKTSPGRYRSRERD